ncbi:MAG TPA: DUF58 domain-containing protein [Longimicrobiaceae bacterium]|nr:DUF58 domain-containing protein [Longimicrobiaceae bacterium]
MVWRRRAARAEPEAPAPGEVLRQVRRIELRTRGLVNSLFTGEYQSVFKGHGIEFAEVREYLPGDDVRTIDWNVTARLGTPYIKRYVEERELTILLVVDLSGSQRWGTRGRLKSDVVVEVAATLAMSAVRNNDRVGLVLATEGVERVIPPRKSRRHALRLVRDLLTFRPERNGTDLAAAVEYAARIAPARSIVFVFSDFQLGEGWESFSRALTGATARHDVVAVHLGDPGDFDLPNVGLLAVRDPETGRRAVLDTSRRDTRERYARVVNGELERAHRLFRRLGVDEVSLETDRPFAVPLLAFFRRRERRLRR